MDNAPISTVGMLFMTDDKMAVRKPVPRAAPHTPLWAKTLSSDAI